MPPAYRCVVWIDGRLSRSRFRKTLLAGALLAGAAASATAADLEATVRDDKGKPVEEAIVYLVATAGAPVASVPTRAEVMDQQNKEFVPYMLAVRAGTSVSFPNNDNIRHNVYSVSAAKRFELPLYAGTPAAPLVFDKPGVVVLGCNIHDWMLAYVYVVTTPLFAKTGADGRAHLPNLATGAYEARVWHPRQREETEKTGQKLTLGPANTQVGFTIRLKREWRIPRRESPRYGEDR